MDPAIVTRPPVRLMATYVPVNDRLVNVFGYGSTVEGPDDLASPVKCNRCGEVYDVQKVEVLARYADCSLFTTPCCNREVDDRMFVDLPAFVRLERV